MKFCEKNVLCEKGDEITRFDGTWILPSRIKVLYKIVRNTDKKENQIFLIYSIRKFRMEQLQSHTVYD
jgi:hypothetical protein